MNVRSIDHVVLTVADVERTAAWFRDVLGMSVRSSAADGSRFGSATRSSTCTPPVTRSRRTRGGRRPGSADVCFLVGDTIEEVMRSLRETGADIELGPVERTGATATLTSVYVRDPDGNLIEVSTVGATTV